jgi:hypothetical protein
MNAPETKRLVSLVITDSAERVGVGFREDHQQWQLFGGRVNPDEDEGPHRVPVLAAIRHGRNKLGLDFHADQLRLLGGTTFFSGGVMIDTDWVLVEGLQVEEIGMYPLSLNREHYARMDMWDMKLRRIQHDNRNSPNLRNFAADCHAGKLALSFQRPDTVQ